MNTDQYGYSLRSQSMVMLALSLAVVKRSLQEFCFYNELPEEDSEKVLKNGIGLLKGDIKPERYAKEFETIMLAQLTADKRKDVKFDQFIKDQIIGRVANSFGSAKGRRNLEETKK